MLNAGQVCTAIDYVFVPTGGVAECTEHCVRLFAERYPDINSPDYTSIIDERAFRRLLETVRDARAKGATFVDRCASRVVVKQNRESQRLVPWGL